jgi:hypothetical protein
MQENIDANIGTNADTNVAGTYTDTNACTKYRHMIQMQTHDTNIDTDTDKGYK